MAYNRFRRFIPPLIIIVVVIIAVVGLVALGRLLFSSSAPAAVDTARENLLNSSVEHKVRMTVRGPIVANEDFRSYEITVTPNSRNMTTYQGYIKTPITVASFSNNIPAYEAFVRALDDAGVTKGTQFEGDRNDTRGLCATGRVVQYDIIKGNDVIKQLWTTTCNNERGSLQSASRPISNLFRAQIPDAQTLLIAIKLQ